MNKRVIAAMAAVVLGVVGVVLLINYAGAANDRAFNGAKLVDVLQVTAPIAANTKAADVAGKVATIKLPRSAIAKGAIKDLAEVAGLSTTIDLEPGEQVLLGRFSAAGKQAPSKAKSTIPVGTQEVSIPLAAARAVAGTLSVGDTVGIIASYQTKEGDGVTQLIRNRVLITRITADSLAQGGQGEGGTQLITIAVKTRDAGKIVNAIEFGKVWLTKQNADTESGQGGSISRNDVTQ